MNAITCAISLRPTQLWRHEETDMNTRKQLGTRPLHLLLAWAFVGIPLLLGVLKTLSNALKLFQ